MLLTDHGVTVIGCESLWSRLIPSARAVHCPFGLGDGEMGRMHPQLDQRPQPMVIAHRGASGYRPEHTLASYALAARMGADCIEPDLVATRDGVLVARHENDISGTTDVASRPEFAQLRCTRTVDGREQTGWFVQDFTFDQVRTLRAVERLPQLRPGNRATDGVWCIASFAEILALRAELSDELGRDLVVYPELKHPSHLREAGLVTEELIVSELAAAGLDVVGDSGRDQPVWIQCFEPETLRVLRHDLGVRSPLLHLMASGQSWTATVLAQWSANADGIGPDKASVLTWDSAGRPLPTGLVEAAHDTGMFVNPYTLRAENYFLPAHLRSGKDPAVYGDLPTEIKAYLRAGVDGFFTDHADVGVAARDAFVG